MPEQPRVAINGFGRIGRLVARALVNAGNGDALVAVNDLGSAPSLVHLLKHDSVHGKPGFDVRLDGDHLVVGDHRVRVHNERDPANLPWRELGIDYAIEATGRFTRREDLEKHLQAGAKRVILTAPSKTASDVDVTLVRGVNAHHYDPEKHRLVSNSSCTTNALATVLKVLQDNFGVDSAVMTTVHAYTSDQQLLDGPHRDPRRARAAALSIVPTTTGAAKAIGLVMPELKGKVDGIAVRVPTPNVSLLDVIVQLGRATDESEIAHAYHQAAEGPMKGILAVETEPLVSSDFNHNPASSVIDVPGTTVVDGNLLKILAWYDNEWAYASRVAELVMDIAARDGRRIEAPPTAH